MFTFKIWIIPTLYALRWRTMLTSPYLSFPSLFERDVMLNSGIKDWNACISILLIDSLWWPLYDSSLRSYHFPTWWCMETWLKKLNQPPSPNYFNIFPTAAILPSCTIPGNSSSKGEWYCWDRTPKPFQGNDHMPIHWSNGSAHYYHLHITTTTWGHLEGT